MLEVAIIAQTSHSSWYSNLVVARKKNGKIRICNVPFPLGSRNIVVVYPISCKPLNGQAREITLVKSLLSYKVKLRKSEFINIKPLFEGIFSND